MAVPTLHIRNVPPEVYERLSARAKSHGRSLNAEVVALLARDVEREERAATLTQQMAELAERINLPADAPKPEDLIRELRDSR